jgi:superfamily II DNA or RNA helicase
MSLSAALDEALPIYEIPDDDLVGSVLVPAMSTTGEVRIAAGFFSSHCFAQIAPGLAAYIAGSDQPLQLLCSPEISNDDAQAIELGLSDPERVISTAAEKLLRDAELSSSALVKHTLDCLAYLVATDRLRVRFVLMKQGMYHKKQWLFDDGVDQAAVHGSGNVTTRGLLVNGEQMTVDRAWCDGEAASKRVELLRRQWDRQWNNEHPHSLTLTAEQGLPFLGRDRSEDQVPTVDDFWEAWIRDHEAGLEPALPPHVSRPRRQLLRIPAGMQWQEGRYGHQGRAVQAFLSAQGRGVLAIATGGGKTKTSLIAATQLQDQHQGPTLVVVLVPSKPLMLQWADEVRDFGLEPVLPSRVSKVARSTMFEELQASLGTSAPRTEVLVASNQLFAEDQTLRSTLEQLPSDVLTILIADEMHNLGTPTFLTNPPEFFDRRLGLSATPVRQYDPDGTDQLFSFFGPQVFEFSLEEAIAAGCLTPYRYYLHQVSLTEEEMDKYQELSEELRKCGPFTIDDGRSTESNPKAERLLRERRAVLEQAENKLTVLRELLDSTAGGVRRTLIYCSAKPSILHQTTQLESVNVLLTELDIISHQFTAAETSRADARRFLDAFGAGDYDVLTAMKVLDEGVDIPQTDTAYLMASSTVVREWVQRRGRILRQAPGKQAANLHDFLVVPPDTHSDDGRAILRGELKRAEEFASLALNEWEPRGPRSVIDGVEDLVY